MRMTCQMIRPPADLDQLFLGQRAAAHPRPLAAAEDDYRDVFSVHIS